MEETPPPNLPRKKPPKMTVAGLIVRRNLRVDGDLNINMGPSPAKMGRPVASPSIWFNVTDPTQSFCGRKDFLVNLHTNLQSQGLTILSQVKVVSGLGGVGKTEAARMYIAQYAESCYENVVWINSETFESMMDSFQDLAKNHLTDSDGLALMPMVEEMEWEKLGQDVRTLVVSNEGDRDQNNSAEHDQLITISSRQRRLKNFVQKVYEILCTRKTLVVFDNAENYEDSLNGIQHLLPPSLQPTLKNMLYILVTSRNRKWGPEFFTVFLDVFENEESVSFIVQQLKLDQNWEHHAKKLGTLLGNLPLALQQAVAYMKEEIEKTRMKRDVQKMDPKIDAIETYIQLFEQTAISVKNCLPPLSRPSTSTQSTMTTELTVYTTWNVTLDKILGMNSVAGKMAVKIIQVLAFMYADNTPKKLLFAILQDGSDDMENVEAEIIDGLRLLQKYSMIDHHHDGNEGGNSTGHISIHRLVQRVIFEDIRTHHEQFVLGIPPRSNRLQTNQNQPPPSSPILDQILNQSCSKFLENLQSADTSFLPILLCINSLLDHVQDVEGNSKKFLTLKQNLALQFQDIGDQAKAFSLLTEVYDLQRKILGPDHPDTLDAQQMMATVVDEQGQFEEALNLNRLVWQKQTQLLGPSDPRTLITQSNMAVNLQHSGQYDEALKICQQVNQLRQSLLGPDHPSSLESQLNLAAILGSQARYGEALNILWDVNARHEKNGASGNGGAASCHPDALKVKYTIAFLLDKSGNLDQALKLYREVFEIQTKIFGPDHPVVLETKQNVAIVQYRKGSYAKALTLLEQVYVKKQKLFGYDHTRTLTTEHHLAAVLLKQENYEDALILSRDVYNLRKMSLPKQHPNTLASLHQLALVYEQMGNLQEAMRHFELAYETQVKVLGPDHRNPLVTRGNIGFLLVKQGKLDQGLKILEEVYLTEKKILGEYHEATLHTRQHIAHALESQGRYDLALKMFQEVASARSKLFGQDNPTTLASQQNVAFVLLKQKRFLEAYNAYRALFEVQKSVLGPRHRYTLDSWENMEDIMKICPMAASVSSNSSSSNFWDPLDGQRGPVLVLRLEPGSQDELDGVEKDRKEDQGSRRRDLWLNKASQLRTMNQHKTAYAILKEELGLGHPDTVDSAQELALSLCEEGKFEEAVRLASNVFEMMRSVLGEHHERTLGVRLWSTTIRLYQEKGNRGRKE